MFKGKLFCFLALAALVAPAAVFGVERGEGTLSALGELVRWEGEFVDAPPATREVCDGDAERTICDEFRIVVGNVDGNEDFWATNPGGLEVTIRWGDDTQQLDLFVYGPDGSLAGASTGFGAVAQSVIVAAPKAGPYTAVVAPASTSPTDQDDPTTARLRYEGIAEFETGFPEKRGDLLPDLVAMPPTNFHFRIGTFTLTPYDTRKLEDEGSSPTCYPDELAELAAHELEAAPEGGGAPAPTLEPKCLRFDGGAANLGDGRLELRMDLSTLASESPFVEQVIHRSDGLKRFENVGAYSFHVVHGHVHFWDFVQYDIFPVNSEGTPADEAATHGRKASFCLIDFDLLRYPPEPTQGNGPRRGAFPDCDLPADLDPMTGKAFMAQGVSRGWADIYSWALPGQFLEVSRLPDGPYDVVITANPRGNIVEADPTNNVACTRIEIEGMKVTEIERRTTGCPRSAPIEREGLGVLGLEF